MSNESQLLQEYEQMTETERAGLWIGLNLYAAFRGVPRVETTPAVASMEDAPTSTAKKSASKSAQEYVFNRLTDDQRARLRRSFVNRVWEYGLRSELVTRVVWLVDRCYLKGAELNEIVERANNDFREKNKPRWQTIGFAISRIYEQHGLDWTPTATALEPKPDNFDENKREPRRVPVTQLLDPDYDPTPEDRTPSAFRGKNSNDVAFAAAASVGEGIKETP